MIRSIPKSARLTILLLACLAASPAAGQLRVVTYNTKKRPENTTDYNWEIALNALTASEAEGIAGRVDVFALQEIPNLGIAQNLATMMNTLHGVGSYSAVAGAYGDGWNLQAFVYDSSTVDLLDVDTLSVGTRPTVRGRFRPDGYSSAEAEFYVFSSHLKAFPGYEWQRRDEARVIRSHGDALGEGANIIYAGDYNLTNGLSEPAYFEMLERGPGQAFDPAGGSNGYLDYTYSSSGPFNRLDFQFVTGELMDNEGLDLIDGTYRVLGPVIRGSRHLVVPWELASASDHLPVIADYQLPARMDAAVNTYQTMAIVGGTLTAEVFVENTADVSTANGADELDYTVGGPAVASPVSGVEPPLGGGATRTVALATQAPGFRQTHIEFTSSSQGVENGSISETVHYTVLDHATASLGEDTEQVATAIDLGIVAWDSEVSDRLDIHNLASPSGYTAALVLHGATGSGDTDAIDLVLPGGGIPGGGSAEADLAIDTSQLGSYTAMWAIDTADESLPGAQTGNTLEAQIAIEVALPGDVNRDGLVDQNDINAIIAGWGSAADGWSAGDLTRDGLVDVDDLDMVRDHWLWTPADVGGSPSVPEPGTLLVMAVSALGVLRKGRIAS
jgi:endonuclease/exonuclease/phosphatase family metal-dependent hydrolase